MVSILGLAGVENTLTAKEDLRKLFWQALYTGIMTDPWWNLHVSVQTATAF